MRPDIHRLLALCCLFLVSLVVPATAFETPQGGSFADDLAFDDPDMYVLNYYVSPDALSPLVGAGLQAELLALGASSGYYDLRAGRWGSLVLARPLVPGNGVGNALTWAQLGISPPESTLELEAAARQAFTDFVTQFSSLLAIDPGELAPFEVTALEGGRLIQINAGRVVGGVPVEGAWVHGVVNSGNLILYGTRNWGSVGISTAPAISKAAALAAVDAYVMSVPQDVTMRDPALKIYPLKDGDAPSEANLGSGFAHRLAWEVQLAFDGDHGSWRALVDAGTGDVFSFADQNHYATRKVVGGVQPISNDGLSPNGIPDGIEQPGWPMPFADIYVNRPLGSVPDTFTNSGGVLACVDGSIATRLSGRYASINDNCGAIDESVAAGDLDLGTSGGTDCTVPPGHSAGDTHSARSGFYEVNRIKEQARSWLPDNLWLQGQLTANMNIDNTCNAFWNGSTINFYRSGGGCGNTGEIAAVFDHEWGHGMDANDQMPGISTPGEAPADHAAMFRLNTSCIGRGFFQSGNCSGAGDPCLDCSGVRETDWAKRASGRPHNITWIKQPTVTPVDGPIAPRGGCVGAGVPIPVLQSGPCLQGTHCEGSVVSEAVWDLMHRDLAGAPYNLDENTRINLVTRLGYLGGTNVNFWFQCVDTPEDSTGGCNADGGYMNYLAVDDDNGDLTDGTPHMAAIHAAFERHQMACPTPAPVDSGCASAPATPTVSVAALDNAAKVSWNAVPGATEYWVFRADGIHGCEFGKERIAITTDTELVDTQLLNGREYFYSVEAVGANESCRSAASACLTVTPAAGANLRIAGGSASVTPTSGDGDAFLDNCETANVFFDVENVGNVTLTNVRITGVDSPSHPSVSVTTSFPATVASTLTDCATATASFSLTAAGVDFNDTVVLRVRLTADEMGGVERTETIEVKNAESDFVPTASHTFDFNTQDDIEGWERVSGEFSQLPGGPPLADDPSGFFLASSTFSDDRCDVIQSPLVQLTGTTTLSLWNQFSIEPPVVVLGNVFYDRANVGILDAGSGTRTTVDPDGGRLYNASGPNGVCFVQDQNGWADAAETWDESTWSSAALQVGAFAGRPVRLHVVYGTDPLLSGAGFQFDFVTLTNFEMQGPDGQSDACNAAPTANDDTAITDENMPEIIDVLANDTDPDNDPLSVGSVTQPANGTAETVFSNQAVRYTPNPGFSGTDVFTYQACDPGGLCDTATVTVTVRGVDDEDDSDSDTDDFDSDGKRDDTDSDDDNDGDPDGSDPDDDNDGDSDLTDLDDDNDGILDELDSESFREEQTTGSDAAPAGGERSYTVSATALTSLIAALVEGAGAENLTVEIRDPAGALVATSVPAPGRALATTVPLATGDYTVTVKNPTAAETGYGLTLLWRQPWL